MKNNEIELVCIKCGRRKVVKKMKTDVKEAVLLKTHCPKCAPEGNKEEHLEYFDANGNEVYWEPDSDG